MALSLLELLDLFDALLKSVQGIELWVDLLGELLSFLDEILLTSQSLILLVKDLPPLVVQLIESLEFGSNLLRMDASSTLSL